MICDMIEAGISEKPIAIMKERNIPSLAPSLFKITVGMGIGLLVILN